MYGNIIDICLVKKDSNFLNSSKNWIKPNSTMSNNNSLKIFKLKRSFNYQIWKIYMHVYLCAKKCKKTIEDKKYVDKNKIAEALSHIRLHLEPKLLIQTQHMTSVYVIWMILGNLYHAIGFNAKFLLGWPTDRSGSIFFESDPKFDDWNFKICFHSVEFKYMKQKSDGNSIA